MPSTYLKAHTFFALVTGSKVEKGIDGAAAFSTQLSQKLCLTNTALRAESYLGGPAFQQ